MSRQLTFGDVFAGCGGISLGLSNASWKGLFAIENNVDAFQTLKTNLLHKQSQRFCWPAWLPLTSLDVNTFIEEYQHELKELKGGIDLLAGGPPCQGFSLAGRRTHTDPRNTLIKEYIKLVQLLEPRFLFIENVQGFAKRFMKNGDELTKKTPYSLQITQQLEQLGYRVFSQIIDFSEYGVPQTRKRFILLAIREHDRALIRLGDESPFDVLKRYRERFLISKGLDIYSPVVVRDAIGDLEVNGKQLVESTDSPIKHYKQIAYELDGFISPFIRLMRKEYQASPTSIRLARHGEATIQRFRTIMETCTKGKTISAADRIRLGIKKQAITPLKSTLPSATVTTLPDDIIHYSEPRILTVRENARLQTFPDWYEFTGNYTTGRADRKSKCPRYTQVGNAVPPLFAEAIGHVLKELAS